MNELREAALRYAEMGIAVFPLIEKKKIPLTANGFKDATTDPEKIEEWWSVHPNANIGIATGEMSGGLVAIDMDIDKEKDKDGYHSFLKWCDENFLVLPDSWLSITGRGGYHLFYKSLFPVPSKIGWLEDVDIRANGGYIVAPPSIHPNGTKYEWEQDPQDYDLITTDDIDVEFVMNSILADSKSNTEPLKVPEEIPEGRRDEMMFKLACKYQAMGMSDSEMEAALKVANQERCKPPLTDKEIRQKLKQAQKYAKGENISVSDHSATVAKRKSYGKIRKIEEEVTEHDLDMPSLSDFQERQKRMAYSRLHSEGMRYAALLGRWHR